VADGILYKLVLKRRRISRWSPGSGWEQNESCQQRRAQKHYAYFSKPRRRRDFPEAGDRQAGYQPKERPLIAYRV
jgi:hypothetical protein